jgi:hypothetical protein
VGFRVRMCQLTCLVLQHLSGVLDINKRQLPNGLHQLMAFLFLCRRMACMIGRHSRIFCEMLAMNAQYPAISSLCP